ncbi:hypothetical protein OEZ85_009026 [Tetradesmus obliquus]|uniref:FAD-binding PCMH-type domain-containing protein n=1 Tax=Tetradesmus obliquus TaxID=3088 RepID=A0ABY8TMM2_TETOB|nr:hypothetical protein OEZ85_009026 [Tetradesmus obliquus]
MASSVVLRVVLLSWAALAVLGDATQNFEIDVYKTPSSYVAAYHYLQCGADSLPVPASTAEVASIISYYYAKASAGQQITVRASRPKFHSTATFVCPVAPSPVRPAAVSQEQAARTAVASSKPLEVAILHNKLNTVLATDTAKSTMRVGAGMTVGELLTAATKAGMSVQIGSLPAYQGLTLAGILATSAHGSGDLTTNTLADTVLKVTWVDGRGIVHVSTPSDPEFRAFNGGLGMFGVITELLMQLTPPTNTELITVVKNDKDMMAEINRLLKISPHMLIHWRPDSRQFKAFLTRLAPEGAAAATGVNMTVLPNTADQAPMAGMFNIWHSGLNDDSLMSNLVCPLVADGSISSAWGSVNRQRVANVTGPTNNLTSAQCDEHCTWNEHRVFNGTAQDAEFTIEFAQLADWIADVKAAFDNELKEGGNASYRCLGLGYMWIRFGKGSVGVTATTSGMSRPVYVQSTWMRSRLAPEYSMRYQFVLDLVEEVTLCKYKGRPHWGKNFDRTFTHPKCPVAPLYPRFGQLLALSRQHDPAGLFRTRLFDSMAQQGRFEPTPHCSALNQCYCSQDSHCATGHRCVDALAFPGYKLCKAAWKNQPGAILAQMTPAAVGSLWHLALAAASNVGQMTLAAVGLGQ